MARSRTPRWQTTALALGAALCATFTVAPAVQAGSLSDKLQSYIDDWRAKGHDLPAFIAGNVREWRGKPVIDKRKDKMPIGKDQIVVLVADNCRTCDEALRDIHRDAPEVEVLNVTTSPTARDAYSMVRARGVPAVIVDRAVMSGWDRKKFLGMRAYDAKQREYLSNDQGA